MLRLLFKSRCVQVPVFSVISDEKTFEAIAKFCDGPGTKQQVPQPRFGNMNARDNGFYCERPTPRGTSDKILWKGQTTKQVLFVEKGIR